MSVADSDNADDDKIVCHSGAEAYKTLVNVSVEQCIVLLMFAW